MRKFFYIRIIGLVWGKIPAGKMINRHGDLFSLRGFANPQGVFTFVMEYFLDHYKF